MRGACAPGDDLYVDKKGLAAGFAAVFCLGVALGVVVTLWWT